MATNISFHVNGKKYQVDGTVSASVSLNEYLRRVAGLPGTKVMCQEGGCGCCAVLVTHHLPGSDSPTTCTIQSCLTPVYMVDGWHITTVEGLGSQRQGFHPIQERVAKHNGTQCGYCTPGMVLSMYGLLQGNSAPSKQEVEDGFDGNLCRCTGYRSILDAMKSFSEGSPGPSGGVIDIEDLSKHICPKTGESCEEVRLGTRRLDLHLGTAEWYRPTSLEDLAFIMKSNSKKQLKLIFGNTVSGVYKETSVAGVYVDLHQVKELFKFEVLDEEMKVGAATTLSQLLELLKTHKDQPGYHYFLSLHKHMKKVAGTHIRNAGSIAGNLMIKHDHHEFVSDVYTAFTAIGCRLEIYDASTSKTCQVSMLQFLEMPMDLKVITAVLLPRLEPGTVYMSFKVAPRWQKAIAYINAGFKLCIEEGAIKGKPNIVYGGISSDTVHAKATETFLEDKKLSKAVVKESLEILAAELKPSGGPTLASCDYRRHLAVNLLYKVFLSVTPDLADPRRRSGCDTLHRPISSGLQSYQEMKSEFPLKHALPKKTATLQASGEAQFVSDIPPYQHELAAAFVLSDVANATLGSIDASAALAMPGVVRFLSAVDIPKDGQNNTVRSFGMFQYATHELFASKEITFCGQPLGMIVAETQREAIAAAKKVRVTYQEVRQPVLTLEESIAHNMEFPLNMGLVKGNPKDAFDSVDHLVEGECKMGHQSHFYLETNVSLAVPSEDGVDLFAATQFSDLVQAGVAQVLGKPMNYVNVVVPRLGGAFGGKAHDSSPVSCAASLAAYLLDRPVRMTLDMSTDMQIIGKRAPVIARYKAGFRQSGELVAVDVDLYMEYGHTSDNMGGLDIVLLYADMAYYAPNWHVRPHAMKTNKQTMTSVRSPGAVPASLIIETILEHAAHRLNLHPVMVKELNLYRTDQEDLYGHELSQCTVREVWMRLKDMAEVNSRLQQVEAFNQANIWKKRGLTMSASKYGISYFNHGHSATVSIFAKDGSVVVTQGGVEMGQGLHMKVAQGVAHALGVNLEQIKVRPNQNNISPNAMFTAASFSSESCTQAAIKACHILRERMQPVRAKFPDADWKELCDKCIEQKVDLSASAMNVHEPGTPFTNYYTCSVAAVETEVDILTGESQIRRVDILADIGESLNPAIDIGQIEGAFVQGLGVFLMEDLIYDGHTGKMLTDGTWDYHVPTSKDIPIDWRIHLLPDRPNPSGVRSSKAIGEPPISLPVAALLANKAAVQCARADLLGKHEYLPSVAPYTVERVQQSVGLLTDSLTL